MALLMWVAQPGMSFCDIDDFAAVISCIAAVLLSPSGIFITAASALAMPSAEQPAVFDLARAGAATSAIAARAAQTVLKIMLVPRMGCGDIAGHEERRLRGAVPAERGTSRPPRLHPPPPPLAITPANATSILASNFSSTVSRRNSQLRLISCSEATVC